MTIHFIDKKRLPNTTADNKRQLPHSSIHFRLARIPSTQVGGVRTEKARDRSPVLFDSNCGQSQEQAAG
jgi:hypothetical protein